MNEMYAETNVKCDFGQKDILKIVVYFAALVVSLGVSLINPILFVLPIGIVTYGLLKVSKLKYEYEYIFCDGQIDFDKITGNVKRKRMMRIDFENCEVVAKETSHALDEWRNKQLKVYDFTSNIKDREHYVIIAHEKENLVKILFEPNAKMVECMRDKSRKLVHVD